MPPGRGPGSDPALAGHGGDQLLRIGVLRAVEDLRWRAVFHDLAAMHDQHGVADLGGHAQVVGDEDQGDAQALLQLRSSSSTRACTDTSSADTDSSATSFFQRQRARDAHALALAAGELIGVAVEGGWLQPHQRQQFARPRLGRSRHARWRAGHRADDAAHGVARIERGEGILEDHLDVLAHRAEARFGHGGDVLAVEQQLAAIDADELQQAFADGGLARAGLAHDAQRLAAPHAEADAVHRVHLAPVAEPAMADHIGLAQVAHVQHRRPRRHRPRSRRADAARRRSGAV